MMEMNNYLNFRCKSVLKRLFVQAPADMAFRLYTAETRNIELEKRVSELENENCRLKNENRNLRNA